MNPTPEVPQVRAIVPGHLGKLNTATPRAVTVDRPNNEGPLTLGNAAIKKAEKTYKGFHGVYSALHVMVALPENPPNPIFEQMWQALTLPDEDKVILTVVTVDSEGGQLDIATKNVPIGWRWEWMETNINLNDGRADIDPNGFDQGSPYNHTNRL